MRRLFASPRNRVMLLALGCWIGVVALLATVAVPYVRLAPGPLFDVLGESDGKPVIEVRGARQYPTTGQLDLTTVSERGGPYGRLTLFEAFTGWLDPEVNLVPVDLLYPPDTSPDVARDQGADQFVQSQEQARIAALDEVGEPVVTMPWIVSVQPDSPAKGVLQHGDVVLSVDGRAVADSREVAAAVRAAGPDAVVRMDIRRGDEESSVKVRTVGNPRDPDRGYIGVTVGVMADSPVEIDFNLADVGGPSAGLIFALGIVDKLTPGDLVAGRDIAGTGTMDYDGRVGPIGGIEQKLAAARTQGVDLFLAPAGNCEQIRAADLDGLNVVVVETLSDAVDALAGRPVPDRCD